MTTEKIQKSAAPDHATVASAALPFGDIDWKGRPEIIAAMCGDMLRGTAALLRKQADLLTDLAGCKDFSQALGMQANFVQSVWADSFSGAQKSLADMGKRLSGPA